MKVLLALYPRAWRRRYGAEFGALLDEQRASPGALLDVLLGAMDAHLEPQVADDGEASLRRRMKELIVKGLRSRTVLMTVGLLLPVALLVATYLEPAIARGGLGLPMAVALATGLLVGRWWAPLPFVAAFPVWLLVYRGQYSGDASAWFAQVIAAWAGVCLLGVGIRLLLARDLAQLRDPRPGGPGVVEGVQQ